MSEKEYPKMLYKGHKENHEHVIADDAEHEAELRESGHVDHLELPDAPSDEPPINFDSPKDVVPQAVYDQVYYDREDIEQKFEAFKNDIVAMKARIAEIQGDTDVGKSSQIDYSQLTIELLREEIIKQGKQFKMNSTKPELIAILEA